MLKMLDQFKTGELVYLVVGALFLINAGVLAFGGGFDLLITATLVYLIGLALVILNK